MLFNSYEFVFIFLPLALLGAVLSNRIFGKNSAIYLVVLFSLFFYAWWNILYLPLLIGTIILNYFIAGVLIRNRQQSRFRLFVLLFGLVCNIALLSYYKYAGFFARNINYFINADFPVLSLAIPLGISFFTFQQIAYLVDTYRNETARHSFGEYSLFVSFFPQLIAGPIVCHKDFFYQIRHKRFMQWSNIGFSIGLSFFIVGLFKKVVIADRLSVNADILFDPNINHTMLSTFDYWIGVSSYTLQIYFDFSGYTDMAIGLARMFGVKLPINFNSPYKSTSIIDFWRRWHITLSNFLKRYVYFSFGGNRKGEMRKYGNLAATMAIGGLWHGAGFTFILWGLMHGIYLIINNIWLKQKFRLNVKVAIVVTFFCVFISWVPFRAINMDQTFLIWQGLFFNYSFHAPVLYPSLKIPLLTILIGSVVVFLGINSNSFPLKIYKKRRYAIVLSVMLLLSIVSMSGIQEFIYFQF